MKTNKPNTDQIVQALLKRAALLSNSRQQLINKHEASLRALRIVQTDRQQIKDKGSK